MYNQEKGEIVEVYGYQFGWIVRYSGVDNTLGKADYKMVSATNPLGVITESTIKDTYLEIDQRVNDIDSILSNNINGDGEYL